MSSVTKVPHGFEERGRVSTEYLESAMTYIFGSHPTCELHSQNLFEL